MSRLVKCPTLDSGSFRDLRPLGLSPSSFWLHSQQGARFSPSLAFPPQINKSLKNSQMDLAVKSNELPNFLVQRSANTFTEYITQLEGNRK